MVVPRALVLMLCALLALAPLPFGLVSTLSQAGFFVAASLLACGTAAWLLQSGRLPVPIGRLKFEASLFVLLLLWILLQLLPIPGIAHPVWSEAAEALGVETAGRISLAPDLTLEALLRLLGYGALFWAVLQIGRDRKAAFWLLAAIAAISLTYAVYGLVMTLGGFNLILWYETDRPAQSVIATFVNRNNYATYAGVGAIATAALLGARVGTPGGQGRVARVAFLRRLLADGLLLIGALVVILTALLLTGSRGGFGAMVLALFLLGALAWLRLSRGTRGRVGALLLALLPLPFVFGLSGERVIARLLETNIDQEGRLAAFSAAIRAIADAPWTGFGYGAFADAFQLYRDSSIRYWFDRLHNDWLEAIFGLGIPAAILLFLLLSSLTLRCLIGLFRRRRDAAYPAAAVATSVLVGVHALTDFSLQLPAVTATWLVLLALGVAQSWRSGA